MKDFETKNLYLNATKLDYAESYQRHYSHHEVLKCFTGLPNPYPENGAYEFIKYHVLPHQDHTLWHWCLFLKEDPRDCIGSIEIRRDDRQGHRGFWLARHLWGQGLMTEAVEPISSYALNTLGFRELILENDAENLASRRIKITQGAVFIDTYPKNLADGQTKTFERWKLTRAMLRKNG